MKKHLFLSLFFLLFLISSCGNVNADETQGGSQEEIFWSWFMTHSEKLFHFENNMEEVFANLSGEMHQIHQSLTFAFGPVENNRRQFVISADGDQNAFPAVEALAAAAPEMEQWEIVAFRPAVGTDSEVKFEGMKMPPENIKFSTVWEGQTKTVELTLYIKDYNNEDIRFKACTFLLLDNALGEYDTETKIGGMVFKDLSEADENAMEWNEIPANIYGYFD